MDLKTLQTLSTAGALFLCCAVCSGTASAQPAQKQYVADFGVAFTQATVVKAQRGLVGLDIAAGRMFTRNLSLGFGVGYDVASFQREEGIYARLAIVPILAKVRYYFDIGPAMQLHASLAGGAYQTIPHFGTDQIGGITKAGLSPGGSFGVGFEYWFLGSQGLGAEFEYNFFDAGAPDIFSYFAVRVNYCLVRM
jgi:hypothetical protein